jgi:hypothetical protein
MEHGACGKCDGKGRIGAFSHYAGGVCFWCKGTGRLEIKASEAPSTVSAPALPTREVPGFGTATIDRYAGGLRLSFANGWAIVHPSTLAIEMVSDGIKRRRDDLGAALQTMKAAKQAAEV